MPNARPARMCASYVHVRSQTYSVTIFSASYDGLETRISYKLDEVMTDKKHLGLLRGLSPSQRAQEQARELASPPQARMCGQVTPVRIYGCHKASMMCHLRITQPKTCMIDLRWSPHRATSKIAFAELHWPERRLTIKVNLCATAPRSIRGSYMGASRPGALPIVSACLPFYFSPDPQLALYTAKRLARWARYMASQVASIRVHIVAGDTNETRAFLQDATADLQRDGRLIVRRWSIYEDLQLRLPSDHLRTTFETMFDNQAKDGSKELNPYLLMPLVRAKCVCEERDESEWTVLFDSDELYKSVPPAPSRTLGQFLNSLPASQHQFLFCAIEEHCFNGHPRLDATAGVRTKPALRTSSDCVWTAGAHDSRPLNESEGDSGCWQHEWVQDTGTKCKSGPLSYYVAHQGYRVGSGFDEDVDCAYRSLGMPERSFGFPLDLANG